MSQDMPQDHALARNLPVTFVNHAAAQHAFDLFHDSEISREIVGQILRFLQFHLLAAPVSWPGLDSTRQGV